MEQLDRLFDAYAEHALTDQERADLSAWLRTSDAHVDHFVRECYLHWQLFAIARRESLHADVMDAPGRNGLSPLACNFAERRAPLGKSVGRLTSRAVLALAACLAIAASAALWSFNRPNAVAQLTQVSADAKWPIADQSAAVGSLLHEGQQLRLGSGRVMATLVSGARIVMEGPAELRVEGRNKIWLRSGRLGAVVPTEATGFTVETPLGQFVDLGTEFTLEMDPDRGCRLFVFTGMVQMRPVGDAPRNRPVEVAQSAAVSYDASSGQVEPIEFSDANKLSF